MKYFKESELTCPCCGRGHIHPELMQLLDGIREALGEPVIVNSGYRCPKHNAEVGGVPGSYHTKGMAADIRCAHHTPEEVAKVAEELGAMGIGIYPTFTHVDVRPVPARWKKF